MLSKTSIALRAWCRWLHKMARRLGSDRERGPTRSAVDDRRQRNQPHLEAEVALLRLRKAWHNGITDTGDQPERLHRICQGLRDSRRFVTRDISASIRALLDDQRQR